MEKSSNKSSLKKHLPAIIFILACLICGGIIGFIFAKFNVSDDTVIIFLICLAFIYAAYFLQIIIHEAGHMVFGLLTGYKFSSFMICSFAIVKKDGKIKFCRYKLSGAAGQCLMFPPDIINGKIPYIMYNLGGVFANLTASLICAILLVFCSNIPIVSALLYIMILVGVFIALTNGIPIKFSAINNDGYNTLDMSRNKEELNAFWKQMKINQAMVEGYRLKDMPDEWFEVSNDEALKNSMIATLAVFNCNRLLDNKELNKTENEINRLLKLNSGILGLHKSLLKSDLLYCSLLNKKKEEAKALKTDDVLKIWKSMKHYPAVMRTKYTYALLFENDKEQAEKIKNYFEKITKSYPYSVEIESEWELMLLADQKNYNG